MTAMSYSLPRIFNGRRERTGPDKGVELYQPLASDSRPAWTNSQWLNFAFLTTAVFAVIDIDERVNLLVKWPSLIPVAHCHHSRGYREKGAAVTRRASCQG
jgi:hypothetical protein